MIYWNVYYWNKHEYCWKWLASAFGYSNQEAIRDAKTRMPEFAKSHMMRVERDWNVK